LVKIFESQTIHNQVIQTNNNTPISRDNQNQSNNNPSVSPQLFTFKKDGDIYFFGTENQLSVRDVEIVHLQHRSVELLSDPMGGENRNRTVGRTNGRLNGYNNSFNNSYGGYNSVYTNNSNQLNTNSTINRNNRD